MKQVCRVEKVSLDNERISLIAQRDLAYKKREDSEKVIKDCNELIYRIDGALSVIDALTNHVVLEAEEGDIEPEKQEGVVDGTCST